MEICSHTLALLQITLKNCKQIKDQDVMQCTVHQCVNLECVQITGQYTYSGGVELSLYAECLSVGTLEPSTPFVLVCTETKHRHTHGSKQQ